MTGEVCAFPGFEDDPDSGFLAVFPERPDFPHHTLFGDINVGCFRY
jgi:hypothetical protein